MPTGAPRYWFVGAAAAGTDDHYTDFVENGYWKLFWAKGEDPVQVARAQQMRPGDRIAIKKMVGGKNGGGRVRIRAVGIIESLSTKESRASVNWTRIGLDYVIPGHGLFASVHGPYEKDDDVVQEVFLALDEAAESAVTILDDIATVEQSTDRSRTIKDTLIQARLGQGKFRLNVLDEWQNRCAITGSSVLEAVRASHIKPWRNSTDDERLDSKNGLALAAHLDALFDAGLITFDESGVGVVSSLLGPKERKIYSLSRLKLRKAPSKETAEYLRYHQATVFRR